MFYDEAEKDNSDNESYNFSQHSNNDSPKKTLDSPRVVSRL